MHGNRPDRVFVRLNALLSGQTVHRKGDSRRLQHARNTLSCGGVGEVIRQEKDLLCTVGADDLRDAVDRAGLDDDTGEARLVHLSARALHALRVIEQFLQIESHKNILPFAANLLTRLCFYDIIITETDQIINTRRKS